MATLSFWGAARLYEREKWRAEVTRILEACGEDRPKAARILGVSVRTLRTWAREIGVDKLPPGPPSLEEK
jgi:DNA-binding transcriptional regulator YiaG